MRVSAPIRRKDALHDVAVKAAVRPISNSRDNPMFDRIVMDVVHVALEVGVVPDCMLPIPSLPNAFLALGDLAR